MFSLIDPLNKALLQHHAGAHAQMCQVELAHIGAIDAHRT